MLICLSQNLSTSTSQTQNLYQQHLASYVEQSPIAFVGTPLVSNIAIVTPLKPLVSSRRSQSVNVRAKFTSTSISTSHIRSDLESMAKISKKHSCACTRVKDRTNMARHLKSCRDEALPLNQRKIYNCDVDDCSSHGFTRIDNLKAHKLNRHKINNLQIHLASTMSDEHGSWYDT